MGYMILILYAHPLNIGGDVEDLNQILTHYVSHDGWYGELSLKLVYAIRVLWIVENFKRPLPWFVQIFLHLPTLP